ncbi:MAG: L,D-transpeptidase [Paracoccaceae bacterium]
MLRIVKRIVEVFGRPGRRAIPGGPGAGRTAPAAMAAAEQDRANRPAPWEPAPGPQDLIVGPWGARFAGRQFPCAIGRGGIRPAAAKREGDGATPAGRWRLTGAYYRADRMPRPLTELACKPIGPRLAWCEDPADPAYNRPVARAPGDGGDRMARGDGLYDLVAVTDHNSPPTPGAGSAIFLHAWRKPRHPTAGCIAFHPRDLEWILARWQPGARVIVRS